MLHTLPSRRWMALALLLVTAAVTVMLGIDRPASAWAAPAGAAPVSHPDADHAGSGLAARGAAGPGVAPLAVTQLRGLDVSSHQGNVNWSSVAANGARFASVKATEGTGYTNPYFSQQYLGSYNAGLIRGAYHFALPDRSGGAVQADFFVSHGGGWSRDGRTLPPALDIEYNPYGATCFGLSQSAMVSWVRAFSNQVHARTSRYPVIYTTTDWWRTCTGNNAGFASTNPLWIARYASSAGTLPAGWGFYTFWQYASSGTFPGDQDVFNGALDRLQALANG